MKKYIYILRCRKKVCWLVNIPAAFQNIINKWMTITYVPELGFDVCMKFAGYREDKRITCNGQKWKRG